MSKARKRRPKALSREELNRLAPAMSPAQRAEADKARLAKLAPSIGEHLRRRNKTLAADKSRLLAIPKDQRSEEDWKRLREIADYELLLELGVMTPTVPRRVKNA